MVLMSCAVFAQSSPKKKKKASSESSRQGTPTTLEPYYPQKNYAPKKSKKSSAQGPTYTAERAYYERREDLEKTRKKNERMMADPQYSDPMYFGHKRPPKKRPAHKMKFCKECGIRH